MEMVHTRPHMGVGPTTRAGRLAGWFMFGFGLAAVLAFARVLAVEDAPEGTFGRAWMLTTGFSALICGLAAGTCGLVAILRRGERSLISYLSLIPGLLAVFFLFTEIVFSH